MREPIGVSLEKQVKERLDAARGLIPRSRYIEKIIVDYLEIKFDSGDMN